MSKQVIKLRLTPVSAFYFGSERHFSSGEDGINYLVRSNYFPQQTSLLGMMRYLALEKNGLLTPLSPGRKPKEAADLVGERSFEPNSKKEQTFGGIHRLSPLFLARRGEILWPRSLGFKNSQPINLSTVKGRAFFDDHHQIENIPLLDGDTDFYKKGVDSGWICPTCGETLSADKIFYQDERDGIIKLRDENDQDAYFKQTMLHLRKDYHFVFYAEVDDNCRPDSGLVMLGGEKSTFRLEVADAPALNPLENWIGFTGATYTAQQPLPEGAEAKFVLVSPALLANDYEKHLFFAIGEQIDFRNLKSTLGSTVNFTDVSVGNVVREKQKLNLLASGTVLYAKNAVGLRTSLNDATHFHNIGYNYFVEA